MNYSGRYCDFLYECIKCIKGNVSRHTLFIHFAYVTELSEAVQNKKMGYNAATVDRRRNSTRVK